MHALNQAQTATPIAFGTEHSMSWDDEDFETADVTTGATPAPAVASAAGRAVGRFDDEEQEDVLDSWDAPSDEEGASGGGSAAAYPAKKKGTLKDALARRAEQEAEDAARRQAALRDAGPEETATERRERQRAMELQADLNNAADLFGEVHITEADKTLLKSQTGGGALSDLLEPPPKTKDEFEDVRKQLAPALKALSTTKARYIGELYAGFVQELAKTLVEPLSAEELKKLMSSLTVIVNAKNVAEKGGPKKANKKAAAKPSVGTMGAAKSAYTKPLDTARRDLDDDGYDDTYDDFM